LNFLSLLNNFYLAIFHSNATICQFSIHDKLKTLQWTGRIKIKIGPWVEKYFNKKNFECL